ncbi:MAG: cytidylyltransferase domain-containing protein [Pirellulales bacterium]
MLKTLGIVQARIGSTRLKGKMTRKIGGKSLLEWVVRRVTDAQRLSGVIVATGDAPDDRLIARMVPPDVPVFFGSERDVLGRFVAALERYPAQAVVRICADNPFIDPVLLDRLIRSAEEGPASDYVGYCSREGRPVILSPVGVYAEWCSAAALRRAARKATDPADREHVTRYLYNHPETFKVRLIPAPPELDRDDVRLTVDFEEDMEHVQAIFDALGPDDLDWQRIAVLLDHQPALRKRMEAMNREHAKV